MNYRIESNLYIPYGARRTPNGLPMCETYYYIVDENNKVINKHTFKTYRGKQMNNYSFKSREGAESVLELIKSKNLL